MKIACKNFVGAAVMVALLGAGYTASATRGRDEPPWRDELGFKNGSQFIVS